MTTPSRVLDTRKPITSRSGVNKASKALDTLTTARAILDQSDDSLTAFMLQPAIDQLSRQISTYYRQEAQR